LLSEYAGILTTCPLSLRTSWILLQGVIKRGKPLFFSFPLSACEACGEGVHPEGFSLKGNRG